MKKLITGIPASSGIVIAKAYKLLNPDLSYTEKKNYDIEAEIVAFENAMKLSVEQIETTRQDAIKNLGAEVAEVFEAHKTILNDPDLNGQIKDAIKTGTSDAPKSVKTITQQFIDLFETMDDPYFKERAADIKDITKRILANLLNVKMPDLALIDEEVIIVATDLTPSETSRLNKKFVKGFATNVGGRTSHAAIMARSLEIPAIVGTENILESVNDDDLLILNALTGEIIIKPDLDQIAEAEKELELFKQTKERQAAFKDKETVTKDGLHLEIAANIGTPEDVAGVLANGAEGIGLYRTEFLYMGATELPSEEVQYEAYKKVISSLENKPVVVRTLDIGGDKDLDYLKFPEEMNPFLGYRAIRLTLDRTDIFRTQLRALLRASAHGTLRIMFPMIATLDEFRQAKNLLFDEKKNLRAEGYEVSDDIQVGIMVEIPSTAIMADVFAKEVDFFSIGTNDLIQYTMAADRINEKVSYLYQPYNPAILRLVKNVIDAANKEGKWAGMCGEMASDPIAITLLVALGLHEFSMSASAVLQSRELISTLDKSELEKHLDTILNLSTCDEVQSYVEEHLL